MTDKRLLNDSNVTDINKTLYVNDFYTTIIKHVTNHSLNGELKNDSRSSKGTIATGYDSNKQLPYNSSFHMYMAFLF
jgi:hypothetical protein